DGDVSAAEGRRVPWSGARQDIQVVLQLFDVDDFRPWWLGLRPGNGHRECAHHDHRAEHCASPHVTPPTLSQDRTHHCSQHRLDLHVLRGYLHEFRGCQRPRRKPRLTHGPLEIIHAIEPDTDCG